MQADTPWEMLPSRQRTRSAPRNSTRFAAQYSARGLPCERFTAVLADRTSCITRGRGSWLDLPRGGLAPPILCQLSWRALLRVKMSRVTHFVGTADLPQSTRTRRAGGLRFRDIRAPLLRDRPPSTTRDRISLIQPSASRGDCSRRRARLSTML